eukprot:892699-Heterocapsa_arctica.AAC.1
MIYSCIRVSLCFPFNGCCCRGHRGRARQGGAALARVARLRAPGRFHALEQGQVGVPWGPWGGSG